MVKNCFQYEKEEEIYYKPVRVNNSWSNNYIEYKIKGDKNRIIEYYQLKNILIKLDHLLKNLHWAQTIWPWNIQLTITFNFISSKDDNDEECVMHSKSEKVEIMISDEVD